MKLQKSRLATLALVFITFLAAIQYAFLRNVPDSVSTFAFVLITNGIGLVILGFTRFKKLRGIRARTLKRGILFALELSGFNFFVLLGSRSLDPVITSSVVSLYFVFVTPILLLLRKKVSLYSGIATAIAIIALLLMFGTDTDALFTSSSDMLYLIIADLFFAAYVVSVSVLGEGEDPTQLTFLQILFSALFAAIGWIIECVAFKRSFTLPGDTSFWISAVFIGIFIRAIYSLIQISSQQHVSALKASLIFSAEIIITLITNPIMCRLLHMPYSPITRFQVMGGVFLILATLMVDDSAISNLGGGNLEETTYVDSSGKTVTRTTVTRKIILATLSFALVTLVASAGIFFSAIRILRTSAVTIPQSLGGNAADISSEAMRKELEDRMVSQTADKARLAQEKLTAYADAVHTAAFYADTLLRNPTAYPSREVEPTSKKNAGIWTMQRSLANESISYSKVREECALLGNMENIFVPTIENLANVSTIYLGTENGLLIAYDPDSGYVDTEGENYYEYRDSVWYLQGKNATQPSFTETYQDGYGRGLTVTCVAPFTDQRGRFAGCIAMDILTSELNDYMINDGITDPSAAALIDSAGNYIAKRNADPLAELGSIFEEDASSSLHLAGEKILAKKNGILSVGKGEEAEYVAFSTIASTDWTLCIQTPASAVIAPAQAIRESIGGYTDSVVNTVARGMMNVIQSVLLLTAVILLVVTLLSGRFSKWISDPLKKLEADVRQVSEGKLDQRSDVSTNDEIGSLAGSFNHMADSLQQYVAELKESTARSERISEELSAASAIQARMLPRDFAALSGNGEFDLFAAMSPAGEVSGDFFDIFPVGQDHLALVIADASEKGVPTALFMAVARTIIKERTLQGDSPAEALLHASEFLAEGNAERLSCRVWLAVLELSTGKGVAANAGGLQSVLRRAGEKFELQTCARSAPLGVEEGIRFDDQDFRLCPGDTLFLFTDGLTETANGQGELFGTEGVLEALNLEPEASAGSLVETMQASVERFSDGVKRNDDAAMLALKYNGPKDAAEV